MADKKTETPGGVPKHFVVIVPGYMGSLLRDKTSGDLIWLDFPGLLTSPLGPAAAVDRMLDLLKYPEKEGDPNHLEPAGILNQVLIAPPWIKQEHYGRLSAKLKEWGYKIDPKNPAADDLCAYTFSYDWRQDNRKSGQELFKAIQGWQKKHPGAKAWLLAHSNGGIISRWCIQKVPGGRDAVDRLILFGSPWDGAPKALKMAVDGLEVLGIRRFNAFNLGTRMKDLVRSFPSFYQLIPHTNPFARTPDNEVFDVARDNGWLDTAHQNALLADALAFNSDLEQESGVDTLCFYGTKKPTTTACIVHRNAAGKIENVDWLETDAGDGTVPERSAVHPWVESDGRLPFMVGHGDIYIYEAALQFLHKEMIDKFSEGKKRASFSSPEFSATFLPIKDFFDPGEAIPVWAELKDGNGKAITSADVEVTLSFVEAVPGQKVTRKPKPSKTFLDKVPGNPGRYEGALKAPKTQGYYRLHCTINVPNLAAVGLDELVVVDLPV